MALFDDASLVVTPNGYKAGTLYSIKPTSGAGDMTVVRATTATRVNSAGLIESVAINVPRLDYLNASCPSLLVEPQRSNLQTYSDNIDNAVYGKTNVTITANVTTSPDGTTNADKIVEDTTNAVHRISNVGGVMTSATTYTSSFFAKKAERDQVYILIPTSVAATRTVVVYNLTTGVSSVVSGSSATSHSMVDYGNGWYRCIVTFTTTAVGTNLVGIYNGAEDYAGTTSFGLFLYGLMNEAGSYPTSYIPTTTAAVTRNADSISKTGISSLIGQSEGVLYAEINALKYPIDINNWLTITDGTNANSVGIVFETTGAATARIEVGGVIQAYISTSVDYSNFIKVAFKYKENDFACWVNGVEVGTDLSGITFPSNTLNSLQFAYGSGSNKWAGNVKLLAVFNEALSDSELETLTT
jgi:hypothetical protein